MDADLTFTKVVLLLVALYGYFKISLLRIVLALGFELFQIVALFTIAISIAERLVLFGTWCLDLISPERLRREEARMKVTVLSSPPNSPLRKSFDS